MCVLMMLLCSCAGYLQQHIIIHSNYIYYTSKSSNNANNANDAQCNYVQDSL
jgi:hypothetical protein